MAIAELQPGDALVIAGKGHETGQIVGDTTLAVQRSRGGDSGACGACGMSGGAVDTSGHARSDARRRARADARRRSPGLSIDSRTIGEGEAYFAIKGDVHDGHAFVEAALKNGAGVAVVERRRRTSSQAFPLLVVPDVLDGLAPACARLARAV